MFILGIAMCLSGAAALAESPLADVRGDLTPDMRELLISVIGEADAPARSLAQARRRAERAAEQALSVMRSQGYYGAIIRAQVDEFAADSDESKRKAPLPVIIITSGSQFTIGDVSFNYQDSAPDVPRSVIDAAMFISGQPALAADVVAAELRAVSYLKSQGYPDSLALTRQAIVDHATKTMSMTFNLKAGDKTRFGDIVQTGDAYLRDTWPKMIAPFESGDLYDDKNLNKLSIRVIATGIFDSAVATLAEEKKPNPDGTVTRNVQLHIDQGKLNSVSGEVGISTTDGSGVDLSYTRSNFIGYAQSLTLTSTLKTNQISFGADYSIPYFLQADRSLDLSAEVAREDTDAFRGERAGANALIVQTMSEKLKIGLGGGLEASRFEENGVDVNAYLIEGLGRAVYDTRDDLLDPTKGIRLEGSVVPTYNFGKNDGLFTKVQAGASTYQKVSDTLILAGRVKAGTIFGAGQGSVPLNRRFYSGGGGSVRGFGYQSISPINAAGDFIGGRSITEASAELRYRGGSPIGAALFVDTGSVTRKDLPTLEDMRYGAGIGLRYYTSFAPLRADIAIPLNKRAGDNSFQIYISIGQAF